MIRPVQVLALSIHLAAGMTAAATAEEATSFRDIRLGMPVAEAKAVMDQRTCEKREEYDSITGDHVVLCLSATTPDGWEYGDAFSFKHDGAVVTSIGWTRHPPKGAKVMDVAATVAEEFKLDLAQMECRYWGLSTDIQPGTSICPTPDSPESFQTDYLWRLAPDADLVLSFPDPSGSTHDYTLTWRHPGKE